MTDFLYLLHFEAKRFHAEHYLGSSAQIDHRLHAHANGRGAVITKALFHDGQHWTLAALFIPRDRRESIRRLEGIAKLRHDSRHFCPKCRPNFSCPPGTVHLPTPPLSSRDFQGNRECPQNIGKMIAEFFATAKKAKTSSRILLLE